MKRAAWPMLLSGLALVWRWSGAGLALVGPALFAAEITPASTITTATWAAYSEYYGKSALCGDDEVTLWSCEHRKRSHALCASQVVTRNSGYVQYRAAERGRITFVYPSARKPPLGSFVYHAFANGNASVDFTNADFRYSLVDPLRRGSSILVSGPGASDATTEIPCSGGNQTLQVNYTMRLMHDAGVWPGR